MKAQTLAARIAAKLTTKGGAIAKKFQDVEKVLLGGRHYGKFYSGRGRYTSVANGTHYTTIEGLRLIGVDFQEGNDAPRGGQSGDFVALTPKGRRQVAEWAKMRKAEIAEAEAKKQADLAAKKARRVAAIKERLDILTANPDTVAKYFPTSPETYTTEMGRGISKKSISGKMWGLAKELHTMKDGDLFNAISFYFLKHEYTAVEYPLNDFNNRIEINYNDIVK